MLKTSKKLKLIVTSIVLILSSNAFSNVEVFNADNGTVEVAISRFEQNVLEIDGRQISSVIPSVNGALAYQKDNENGVLYFTLANENFSGTISVFVNDNYGDRYKLLLVPSKKGSQEITIIPPMKEAEIAKKEVSLRESTGSYVYEIKKMIFDMAQEGQGIRVNGISKTQINQKVPLWKEAELILANGFDNGVVLGEEYYLTNITQKTLVIREQEFYRNNVLAVSIDKLNVEPGETAIVYVIRGK